MEILLKLFTWSNLQVSLTQNFLIMCVNFKKLSMVSNKHPVLGFNVSVISCLPKDFFVPKQILPFFIFKRGNAIIYLLVYVDDIIITVSDTTLIQSFVTSLHNEFSVKDLGALGYFLGLEVTYIENDLFLSQAKYTHDILARAGLLDSKPVDTPLAASECFLSKGEPFHDPTLYRSLVGALQYLTITRPDLSYDVNQASQYLQSPTTSHFQSVKRILRYVKGTISFGLTFSKPTLTTLVGYSDAD
ncbi:uncharacterized mitochondrial protein AtMg00810-like [Helianthus annuus]|uniref:uncharacterized mitochondrial protein AtMg00810-like n=1 Tax=Helianthus annuus TaxID=4232 RepID=UPI000B908CBD|nr:uncharacterized mitochondrial protein AtMg00810-like [Helianthus annuus]